MSTPPLEFGTNPLRHFIDGSIKENMPRKYKRTVFITSLIYLLDNKHTISRSTFKKIVKLFDMGINNESNLRYTYYIRNYVWSNMIKSGYITINDESKKIIDFIKEYKMSKKLTTIEITDKLIDAIFSNIPDFIKYGSDRLMKYDISNVLFFIKHRNTIRI